MVFGGRKWNKWKTENSELLRDILKRSEGDADYMKQMLNDETNGKCKRQIGKFIKKNKKLGILK